VGSVSAPAGGTPVEGLGGKGLLLVWRILVVGGLGRVWRWTANSTCPWACTDRFAHLSGYPSGYYSYAWCQVREVCVPPQVWRWDARTWPGFVSRCRRWRP
jgi:hypothetical protein